ncbi:MAG: hypothetical protein WC693_01710 [Patescibacteria group bacterium]|jgi:hypothetical protein
MFGNPGVPTKYGRYRSLGTLNELQGKAGLDSVSFSGNPESFLDTSGFFFRISLPFLRLVRLYYCRLPLDPHEKNNHISKNHLADGLDKYILVIH